MGMPALLTQNGTGTSAIWTPDWMQDPFNIAIGVINPTGAGFFIEATLSDLNQGAYTAGSATWYNVNAAALAVSTTMNVQFPVTGLRINVVTGAVASAVSANFIQATFGR